MAYKYGYTYKENNNNSKEKSRTILRVTFRFRDEVAPKDRKKVDERISFDETAQLTTLADYLVHKENIGYAKTIRGYGVYGDGIKAVKIRRLYPGFVKCGGFKIIAITGEKISLEKMLDLDALNEFILTGEVKDKK